MKRRAALLATVSVALYALLGGASIATATHVAPIPISEGNPSCDDFAPDGETWDEVKFEGDDLADGALGGITIDLTQDGDLTLIDWDADFGVDAVFVKAGSQFHNLYLYDPEETSDTGLHQQAGAGNGLSHISFCFDDDVAPTPTETATATATATATGTEIAATPTLPDSGSEEPAVGTPSPTLPSTSTVDEPGEGGGGVLLAFLLVLLAAGAVGLVVLSPASSRIHK